MRDKNRDGRYEKFSALGESTSASAPRRPSDAEREAQDQAYGAKRERVRRGELCYYCMELPPTKTALHAADGHLLPACDDCFARQVDLLKAKTKTSRGCLLIGIALLVLAGVAIKACL